jgi:Ca2+-transporting ATPase
MVTHFAHACSEEALLYTLRSSPAGLTNGEAERRLRESGPNELRRARGPSAIGILVSQLRSVVVLLLVAATAVSFLLGERIEAVAIAAVLAINTAIGFVTEWRARRAMASLLTLDSPQALVLRDGQLRRIAARLLVPGDVIEIGAGQHVPADGRILTATNAQVDESALTGESMPVEKHPGMFGESTPLADRANMVHKATTMIGGTARVLVTATGMATEVGEIGTLVEGVQPEQTPLERRLDALGHRLVWLALAVAGIVAALGVRAGRDLALVGETAIALAVAAVPESLPVVVTIALAVGMHRMARRKALVRRLPAVETLGSTTVICTDKTRTLTSGDMSVDRIWAGECEGVAGRSGKLRNAGLQSALETAVLASREQAQHGGDPVDRAILRCGRQFGIDIGALHGSEPAVAEIPFSSDLRLQASFHYSEGALNASVKGAPRQVIERCARDHEGRPLSADDLGRLWSANDALASAGLRVIAMAAGPVETTHADGLQKLAFKGFVGLIDPPAAGVKETIARLREAGLRTVMLTGDQRLRADAQLLDGRDLLGMHRGELIGRVGTVTAYSRVTPSDKLAIVEALQANGEVVAMVGDGVNDAAALKRADVGVSMGGRGTDVAKEAAAIILQDDRFETVAAAVEEGRVIFDNIRKSVFYLFSCNVAEIFVVLTAAVAAWPLPVYPLQLLWVNMLTDTLPALSLAMEPGDPRIMQRPPRNPKAAFLSKPFLIGIGFYGALITASTLSAFWWIHGIDPAHAQTGAFMALGMSQTFHLVNARRRHAVTGRAHLSNPYAIAAVMLAVGLQLLPVWVAPLGAALHVARLGQGEWTAIAIASVAPAVIGQALRALRRPRQNG